MFMFSIGNNKKFKKYKALFESFNKLIQEYV